MPHIISNNTKIYVTTEKKNAREKGIESCLKPIMEAATYYNRCKKFGTVEVRFATEEESVKHSRTILSSVDLLLLPISMRKRNEKVVIGRIYPDIQEVLLVVAIMTATHENAKFMSAGRTQRLYWWGYGVEISLQATH